MFVRFRRYQLRKGGKVLRAELVESYRDESKGGGPRNRFIAYLGSIKEQNSKTVVQERLKFWREVDRKLANLSLTPDGKQRIRERLLEKVPHPQSWMQILRSRLSVIEKTKYRT